MEKTIYVTRPFLPPKQEYDEYVQHIWDEHYLTNNGPLHKEFEQRLREFTGVPNVTLTVNGHMALEIALEGLGIKGEVITTPFTFASTTHALSLCGIKPVFADIREEDLTLDPQQIENKITERTTAIMPVHVYGHLCDVKAIGEIARKYGLKVIYDAAHAFGVTKDGVSAAAFGDVSMFSFHATKLFHTIEGGALCYSDGTYTRIFNAYKNFGIEGEEHVPYVGGNAKMNEFQAAMGLANLPHVPALIEERRAITLRYRDRLQGVKGLRMFEPEAQLGVAYNYAYLPILIDAEAFGASRDDVYFALKRENIFSRRYFWPIVPDFECYRDQYAHESLPVARKAGAQVLCLPIYNGLALEEVDRICGLLRGVSHIG